MELLTNFPDFFFDILDKAAKAKRLPMNRETAQIFWDHIRKYSTKEDAIRQATERVIEQGYFLDPGNIIRNLPRVYPEQKNWPTTKDIDASTPIARDSLKLIYAKMAGKLTQKQYFDGMMELHEKYPRAGFIKAAERYAALIKNKT